MYLYTNKVILRELLATSWVYLGVVSPLKKVEETGQVKDKRCMFAGQERGSAVCKKTVEVLSRFGAAFEPVVSGISTTLMDL